MGSKKGNVNGRRKVRRSQVIEKNGSPHWTFPQRLQLGLKPAKGHENRRLCRMAALGAARSRLAMEQSKPSNCLTRSVRD
jgi:hypothetical protein